jgi:hypothetical protein
MQKLVSVARSQSNSEGDRRHVYVGLSFDAACEDEAPDMLVARWRKPELRSTHDQRTADFGIGQLRLREPLEPVDQSWVETRSSCRHSVSVTTALARSVPNP